MIIKERTKDKIKEAKDVVKILQDILAMENEIDKDKEHFWVIGLSGNNQINYIELSALGILNATLAHPREIFRLAIMKACATIIIAHNHPSGSTSPSNEDKNFTKQITESGKILGIKVLDHIIIGNECDEYYSFADDGIL